MIGRLLCRLGMHHWSPYPVLCYQHHDHALWGYRCIRCGAWCRSTIHVRIFKEETP